MGGEITPGTPSGHHQDIIRTPPRTPGHRRATAEHRSRRTFVLISLQQRRDHFSCPPTQLRLPRSHERNETISQSGDFVPLRPHLPTSDLLAGVAPAKWRVTVSDNFIIYWFSHEAALSPGTTQSQLNCWGWCHPRRLAAAV